MNLTQYLSSAKPMTVLSRAASRGVLPLLLLATSTATAFESDFYAETSALSSGRWAKISVEESGLYALDAATLRSWGFNDPEKVRIHGYGGRRIEDILTTANYVDDLPEIPSAQRADGSIVFYAAGPETWVLSTGVRYHAEPSPYTSYGYYFITESDTPRRAPEITGTPDEIEGSATTVQARIHHELETSLASEAGPLMVGESFLSTRTRSFSFDTPGRTGSDGVWMECQFVHKHIGSAAQLSFTIDGKAQSSQSTDRISATTDSHYVHASLTTTRHTLRPESSDKFTVGVTYTPSVTPTLAALDYLSFSYTRALEVPTEGYLLYWSNRGAFTMPAVSGAVVWDVTSPTEIRQVDTGIGSDGSMVWATNGSSMRAYAIWTPSAKLPTPTLAASSVSNQNLHAEILSEPVDMIIFSPGVYNDLAQRIANLHTQYDGLKVRIVDPEQVYNEFSSGSADVSGLRKYLKMAYDTQADSDTPLRFALLLGRTTLDHRALLASTRNLGFVNLPWWVVSTPRLSLTDNDGYGTDDFLAMLEDGSGKDLGFDDLCIAVGRMPFLSPEEGSSVIDKLEQYMTKSKKTGWKNRMVILADDEDQGVHLRQAESLVSNMEATTDHNHLYTKVYIDAYELSGGTYPAAREEMYRTLDEGAVWWMFTGHANNHSWTGENMLTYSDINSLYFQKIPFVVASTCDFLRWDSETISGGEIMYKERYGGAIGMISATRPVYISDNAYFLNSLGRHILERNPDGKFYTSGEIYRNLKNDIRNTRDERVSNPNRLRFVFMGDPALQLAPPSNIVRVNTINGQALDLDAQITLPAMSSPVIEGEIVGPDGQVIPDFDGVVNIEIFDATESRTGLAHGNGKEETFDVRGSRLYAGATTAKDGRFTLKASMPSQVADNFRPATMSLYAYATNSDLEAIGANSDFYVYGLEEPETPDTSAPVIKSLVLNHSGFQNGEMVNSDPMLIASVEDNVSINLSMAGVGQTMSLTLDGSTSYNDVASFYTASPDGTPSGTINYQLESLSEGAHTLRLRVFDTTGNLAEKTIDFYVTDRCTPRIFEVYSDANPASTVANFYVRHDRPDNTVEVTVSVYDLNGRPIWSGSAKGVSDMDVSAPVSWNLCDNAGRRVPRGIYLFRASITTDNERFETSSQRIAVTAE